MEQIYALFNFFVFLTIALLVLISILFMIKLTDHINSDTGYSEKPSKLHQFLINTIIILLLLSTCFTGGVASYYKKQYELVKDQYDIQLEIKRKSSI